MRQGVGDLEVSPSPESWGLGVITVSAGILQ